MCVCVYIYIYIYEYINIFLNQSSVAGHLSYFHVLAIAYSAVMNIGLHVSFQIRVSVFFRYVPRSGIARSFGSFIFLFFKEPPYCFPQWLHTFAQSLKRKKLMIFGLVKN